MSLSSETPGAEADDQVSDPAIDRVAASVAALDTLADLPLSEHADVYQHVHAQLHAELAAIDGG